MSLADSMTALLFRQREVTDLFYSSFLSRYPDVCRFFERVNLADQGASW